MSEIIMGKRRFSAKAVGTDEGRGGRCSVLGRKNVFRGCTYDVLLEAAGKDEPRLLASGTFPEAIWALKARPDMEGCIALLKAVSLCLGDKDSELTRGMGAAELSALAALRVRRMTAEEISSAMGVPVKELRKSLKELKKGGMVWQSSEKADPARHYNLSRIGRQVCEVLATDEKFPRAIVLRR